MATHRIFCHDYSRAGGITSFFRNSEYRLASYTNLNFDELLNLFKEKFKQKYGLAEFSREAIDGTRLDDGLGGQGSHLVEYDNIMETVDELRKIFYEPVYTMVYNGKFEFESGNQFEGHGIGFVVKTDNDRQIYIVPDTNLLISGGKEILRVLKEKDISKFTQRDDIDLAAFCPKCSDDPGLYYFINSNMEVVGTEIFMDYGEFLEYCERTLKDDSETPMPYTADAEQLKFYIYTAGENSDYYGRWYTSGYVTGFFNDNKDGVYVLPTGRAFNTPDWNKLCDKMKNWDSSKTSSFLEINRSNITYFKQWCIDENEPGLTQLVYNGKLLSGGVYPNVNAYKNHYSGEMS